MPKIPLLKKVKYLLSDWRAMRDGLPGNEYELGRYQELYGRLKNQYVNFASGMHYDAANQGRLQEDWTITANTPTQNFKPGWRQIIARSIKSVDNNPHTKALLNALTSNVIGTGLRPQPRIKYSDGTTIDGINKLLSEGWKRYNDEWDSTQRNTHLEAQKTRFGEMFTTGSLLTNKVAAPKGSYLSIQNLMVNILRLDDSRDYLSTSFNDPQIKNTLFGINLNSNGVPVSYWVKGFDNPLSSDNIWHSYKQTSAEMFIGVPWIVTALKYLWANENLIGDKLISSRIQSMIGMFVPNSLANRLLGSDLNSNNQIEMAPGKIIYGEKGDEPTILQADDSIKDVLEPLQRLLLHAISMTLGISYQTVTRDLVKTNMASGRINTNEDRKTYQHLQRWFAKEVCQKDWNTFVKQMFAEGRIPGKGIVDYLKDPWKYNQVQWQGPGFDFIDPSKEATAAIDLINANMSTLDRWYAEKYGSDWRDELTQISEEKKLMKSLGIDNDDIMKSMTKRGAPVNQGDEENDNSE